MPGLFHVIEGAQAVLRQKGVFRQVAVYQRDGELAAKWNGGFIMLRREGGTTHPDVLWDWVEGTKYETPKLGNLRASPPLLEGQANRAIESPDARASNGDGQGATTDP